MRIEAWARVGGDVIAAAPAEECGAVLRSHWATRWQVDASTIQPARLGAQAGFRFTGAPNRLPGSHGEFRAGLTRRASDARGDPSAELAYARCARSNRAGAVGRARQTDPGAPHWTPARLGSIQNAPQACVCGHAARPATTDPH